MDHLGETYPPGPACEFPNSLLEPDHRLRRETPLRWLVLREAEPQEFPFPWSSHRTLLAVHSQLELRREESLASRTFCFALRQLRFGPSIEGHRGCTPTLLREG